MRNIERKNRFMKLKQNFSHFIKKKNYLQLIPGFFFFWSILLIFASMTAKLNRTCLIYLFYFFFSGTEIGCKWSMTFR